jgi:rare lipoprotein A
MLPTSSPLRKPGLKHFADVLIKAAVALVAALIVHLTLGPAKANVPNAAIPPETAAARQFALAPSAGERQRGMSLPIDSAAIIRAGERLQRRLGRPGAAEIVASTLRRRPPHSRLSGIASTYNPCKRGYRSGGLETASGETYDPDDWSAAIQIDLRAFFGGVHYGRNYRPAFALVTVGDKRAIVRINDVGPLLPGRVVDLNETAMHYFDPAMKRGLLRDIDIAPLAGTDWRAGPLEREADVGMAGDLLRPTMQ